MKRRVLSFVLAVFMLLSSVNVTVLAAPNVDHAEVGLVQPSETIGGG